LQYEVYTRPLSWSRFVGLRDVLCRTWPHLEDSSGEAVPEMAGYVDMYTDERLNGWVKELINRSMDEWLD